MLKIYTKIIYKHIFVKTTDSTKESDITNAMNDDSCDLTDYMWSIIIDL